MLNLCVDNDDDIRRRYDLHVCGVLCTPKEANWLNTKQTSRGRCESDSSPIVSGGWSHQTYIDFKFGFCVEPATIPFAIIHISEYTQSKKKTRFGLEPRSFFVISPRAPQSRVVSGELFLCVYWFDHHQQHHQHVCGSATRVCYKWVNICFGLGYLDWVMYFVHTKRTES